VDPAVASTSYQEGACGICQKASIYQMISDLSHPFNILSLRSSLVCHDYHVRFPKKTIIFNEHKLGQITIDRSALPIAA
jgi:hypothetical protein